MTAQCILNTKREIDDNQLRFIALLSLRVDATQKPHHDQAEVPQQASMMPVNPHVTVVPSYSCQPHNTCHVTITTWNNSFSNDNKRNWKFKKLSTEILPLWKYSSCVERERHRKIKVADREERDRWGRRLLSSSTPLWSLPSTSLFPSADSRPLICVFTAAQQFLLVCFLNTVLFRQRRCSQAQRGQVMDRNYYCWTHR
jgi:hypothetical protein